LASHHERAGVHVLVAYGVLSLCLYVSFLVAVL